MANTFLISDPHFGHANILNFTGEDGSLTRPGFSTVEEMDEHMVKMWNGVVRDCDKVYCLGDVVMNKKHLPIVGRLNGKKSLVMGNHDIFDAKEYLKWFRNVRGIKVFDNHVLTHMPVMKTGRFIANIHGHTHTHRMDDPWWFNVSVECIGYTPIPYEEAKKQIQQNQSLSIAQ